MATENILIKFSADLSGLKSSIEEMQKLGKITDEDKKKYDALLGTVEGIDDALKEVGIEAKNTSKEFTKASESGKSLRSQLAEAKNEAVRLSQAFGPFSKEAREAAKRAAELKDQISDMNDTLDALNPEAKLNAFVKLGQGIQGGFQAATGALQVFGVENERITKLAQQFQGVLNLTQGINSVLQLKDVYGQLRLVLGLTTVATEGATAATAGFSAALTATGIGAIVIALGALAAAWIYIEKSTASAERAAELYDKRLKDLEAASKLFGETFNKKLAERIDLLDFEIKKAEARGATEKEILILTIQRRQAEEAALNAAIRSGKATIEQEEELVAQRTKNGRELELQKIRLEQILKAEREINRVKAEQAKGDVKPVSLLPSPKTVEADTRVAMDVIGKTITSLSTDLPPLPFFTDKELEERKESITRTVNFTYDAFSELSSGLQALNQQLYENDLANLQESKEAGYLTEKQFQDRVKALRLKAFEANKKFQIAEAIMGTAAGVINALSTKPREAVPAAIALAVAVGAINLGRILAVEPPQFKKGTLNVGGGNVDADGGMHAIIHKGEAVIPKEQNREYHPTIKALYNRQVKASDINSFVQMKLQGKIPNSIDAKIDHRKLGSIIAKNGGQVEISNAKMLGKAIAAELYNHVDIRR